ncbi:MAG: hypothetical protein ACRC0L_04640 [Angustibacter sp.]
MPEGDVVWRTAERLRLALAGRPLTRTDFRWPTLAEVSLSHWLVEEVLPRGKHLLIRVRPCESVEQLPLTIHSHLRMDGTWTVRRSELRGRDPRGGQLRVLLANHEWSASGYLLGMLDVLPTRDEARVVGHLGPDILGPDWDPDEVIARLRAEPGRPIGAALLDQRNLAGVGTYFMAEALFGCSVSPWSPVERVPDLAAVLTRARRLLQRGCLGSSHGTGQGARTYVHGRARRPCRRCGEPIRVDPIGVAPQDRVAFHCPRCQPG